VPSNPVVTVLLTHHLDENRKYVDLALKSVLASEGIEFEVILLCDTDTVPEVPPSVLVVHDNRLDTATKKVHHGIKLAHPASKYFLLLSDDVIVSKDMIANMVKWQDPEMGFIMNPLSNSDIGGRILINLQASREDGKTVQLKPDMDYSDMEGFTHCVQNFGVSIPMLVRQPWVSFFCTMIPRKVWEIAGPLDEALEYRHNDEDLCLRAERLGIPTLINFSAFAFHFGTKTLYKAAKPGEMDEASRHFARKWGKHG